MVLVNTLEHDIATQKETTIKEGRPLSHEVQGDGLPYKASHITRDARYSRETMQFQQSGTS